MIVVPPPEPYQENPQDPQEERPPHQEGSQPLQFPDTRLPDSRQIGTSQDERTGIYAELELKATIAAEKRAQLDINAYKYRQERFPTKDYLRDVALLEANDAITFTYLQKGKIDTAPLRQHYIQAYLRAYDAYLLNAGMNGMIASEEERAIQQRARDDAAQDKDAGLRLSEVELTCQAAIRAQERLKLATLAATGYLTHVLKYIQAYEPAYREEQVRPQPRPVPFPGTTWQQPGR